MPVEVAPQPIAFSHKVHASAEMECVDCHSGAWEAERAGIPQADVCLLCHHPEDSSNREIGKLSRYQGDRIPWVRVYRLPDYVFFSHASHVVGGGSRRETAPSKRVSECGTCHGEVAERDVLIKEVSTSMIQCMECHEKREASTECSLCHELGA